MAGRCRTSYRPAAARLLVGMAGALALAACAGKQADTEQAAREAQARETIDKILTEPLEAEEYGKNERCLSTYAYRSVDVIDDTHVLFRGSGDKMWLNTLRNRCLGLRPNDTLRFSLRNNRVCDLDTFESVDYFAFIGRSSATCSLGSFTPVTAEQVEAIEAAVEESRGR